MIGSKYEISKDSAETILWYGPYGAQRILNSIRIENNVFLVFCSKGLIAEVDAIRLFATRIKWDVS